MSQLLGGVYSLLPPVLLSSAQIDEQLVQASGKFLILDRMLPALKKRGHKVSAAAAAAQPAPSRYLQSPRCLVLTPTLHRCVVSLQVLIFSQMTSILDILMDYCFLRGFQYSRLDGSMSYADREENVSPFTVERFRLSFLELDSVTTENSFYVIEILTKEPAALLPKI